MWVMRFSTLFFWLYIVPFLNPVGVRTSKKACEAALSASNKLSKKSHKEDGWIEFLLYSFCVCSLCNIFLPNLKIHGFRKWTTFCYFTLFLYFHECMGFLFYLQFVFHCLIGKHTDSSSNNIFSVKRRRLKDALSTLHNTHTSSQVFYAWKQETHRPLFITGKAEVGRRGLISQKVNSKLFCPELLQLPCTSFDTTYTNQYHTTRFPAFLLIRFLLFSQTRET